MFGAWITCFCTPTLVNDLLTCEGTVTDYGGILVPFSSGRQVQRYCARGVPFSVCQALEQSVQFGGGVLCEFS
jgi:hypothetical protein